MSVKDEIYSVDIMKDEDLGEVIGLDDDFGDLGTVVNTFSLAISDNNNSKDFEVSNIEKDAPNTNTLDSKKIKPNSSPKGLTTPIDGELFNIKRSYQFRSSTLRKLLELKSKDPDINIYLNQIIDKAICFYYDHITK
ncbi:hypothetical protein DWV13_05505 [Clostridium botulinum]|uniref:hypothetical protein n=1 Tax=Clostridium TaxID=1485 RepID=UPI0013FA8C57|nr:MULTISPECIES: hypothetical protein [Clostridium]MCS6131101.1 hypothetical protein [Clostridium botulinum]NFL45351.1 hypothetical protein [Clostridium botulinum]NFL90431.1 hypothetical protein [Clostridium botulinum]